MIYPKNTIKPLFPNDRIAAIAFMQRLHKHKGPLFVYKKNPQASKKLGQMSRYLAMASGVKGHKQLEATSDEYIVKQCLDFTPLRIGFVLPEYTDTALIRYHPYLHLLNQCYRFFGSLQPTQKAPINISTAANTIAICEWLRAYMKYPPLAAQVRAFEQSTLKQAKEVKTYLRGFFREDTLFYWHSILIGFAGQITTPEELTYKLTEITVFRTKLLSQLKNHDLITEEHTRYCWKIIVIGNQLSMHLQILHRQLFHKEEDIVNTINHATENKNNKEEQFIKQIKQSAETVKIPISPEPSVISSFSIDTKEVKGAEANPKGTKQKKVKRANFNACLEAYFNQDFWFAYYQIACENPKKMLFGKGNDKGGK